MNDMNKRFRNSLHDDADIVVHAYDVLDVVLVDVIYDNIGHILWNGVRQLSYLKTVALMEETERTNEQRE